jgi:hypothetical protein
LFNEFRTEDVNAHGYQVHIPQKKALDKHDTHPETMSQRKLVEAVSRSLENANSLVNTTLASSLLSKNRYTELKARPRTKAKKTNSMNKQLLKKHADIMLKKMKKQTKSLHFAKKK